MENWRINQQVDDDELERLWNMIPPPEAERRKREIDWLCVFVALVVAGSMAATAWGIGKFIAWLIERL